MKKLFTRLFILFTPLMVLVLFFVIEDPMKVVYHYDNPLIKGVLMNDRDYQAKFLEQNKIPYNAFILGSSRSKMYQTTAWSKYLGNDANCFHLGVNDESIWGVTKKIVYLDDHNYAIKYCLLPIDVRLLRDIENNEAHIFRDHPIVSGETYLEYYKYFMIAFFKPDFLKNYLTWKATGVQNGTYFWRENFTYNKATGDIIYAEYDSLIKENKALYYQKNAHAFFNRDSLNATWKDKPALTEKTRALLHEIKNVFDKHHTQYQIILTPNYEQIPFNKIDLDTMYNIFGRAYIHNFSGKNSMTDTVEHYYEYKHFKPFIANQTLEKVF